jgi:PAS domain S-box-containing protein
MILAEQMPVMIWRSDTSAARDYFSELWLEFTGRTMEEETGDGWAEGVHPDEFDHCMEIYLSAFNKREAYEMEYRLRRHDGEYRWVLNRGTPCYDEDGKFVGFIGSCIDIHDTVLARNILREMRENELKTLRGLLPICVKCKKIRDDEGYWNQIEIYLKKHADVDFTHGFCPDCMKELYPEDYEETS